MNTFGEYLRRLRKDKSLSLRDLSLRLKVDSSLIAKIERNERSPSKEFIRQVANFFKIEEQKLFNEFLSDFIAYKIIEENGDIDILKAAEEKVNYIKNKTDG